MGMKGGEGEKERRKRAQLIKPTPDWTTGEWRYQCTEIIIILMFKAHVQSIMSIHFFAISL